jgi:hypothetical protein
VDSVHGSWTITGHGPQWTDHHGRPQSSTELGRSRARRPTRGGEWGEVRWRTVGLSLYIGDEGEAAAGDEDGEMASD